MGNDDRDVIEEQITYYRRRAPDYDEIFTPPHDRLVAEGRRLEAALEAFDVSGMVLEIASGTGAWTQHLLGRAQNITAVDASPEMIEICRSKLGDVEGIDYVVADVFTWQPQDRYDVVFFANWLSHVPPTRFDDFWKLVERALAPDGRVFFVDEGRDAWRTDAGFREEYVDHPSLPIVRRQLNDGSHHRVVKVFWDPGKLEDELRSRGWDIEVRSTGAFLWGQGGRAYG